MVITPDNASLWLAAQKIVDIPAVDDAIMTLLSDMTGDNATHVVVEVLKAINSLADGYAHIGVYSYKKPSGEIVDWTSPPYSRRADALLWARKNGFWSESTNPRVRSYPLFNPLLHKEV